MRPVKPTLVDVIEVALARERRSCWSSLPGVVTKYDSAKRLADVQPTMTQAIFDDDDIRVYEALPIVPSCPVFMLGAGDFRLELPIAPGAGGILIFSSLDMTAWLVTGSLAVNPGDVGRSTLASAFFLPGIVPKVADASAADPGWVMTGDSIKLGGVDATDPAAMSSLVLDRIQTLVDAISGAAVAISPDAGAAFKANILAALTSAWGGLAVPHVESANVVLK